MFPRQAGQAIPGDLLHESLQLGIAPRRVIKEAMPQRAIGFDGGGHTCQLGYMLVGLRRGKNAGPQVHHAARCADQPGVRIPYFRRAGHRGVAGSEFQGTAGCNQLPEYRLAVKVHLPAQFAHKLQRVARPVLLPVYAIPMEPCAGFMAEKELACCAACKNDPL